MTISTNSKHNFAYNKAPLRRDHRDVRCIETVPSIRPCATIQKTHNTLEQGYHTEGPSTVVSCIETEKSLSVLGGRR